MGDQKEKLLPFGTRYIVENPALNPFIELGFAQAEP